MVSGFFINCTKLICTTELINNMPTRQNFFYLPVVFFLLSGELYAQDEEHLSACKKAVELRKEYTLLILKLAKESAETGEPIVRSMEYVFPHHGYERVKDQFLLGEKILVAPLLQKGETSRKVFIPKGNGNV